MNQPRELTQLLDTEPLHDSLLLGFYGGGNYGDELLMEVLAGLLHQRNTKNVSIAYQHPELYNKFHHDFGFARINMHGRLALIGAILRKKRLVVGGGGLWGMDANMNIVFMSVMLLVARWVLRKKVYLLAVGYYDSAPLIGRIGAWCAAKAAHVIVARDEETYRNFLPLHTGTTLDTDIAWYIEQLDLTPYQADLAQLEQELSVQGKTIFITLRRFHHGQGGPLTELVEECLQYNPDKHIIIALMEPRHIDPAGYRLLKTWQRQFDNVQVADYGCNPLALFLFFQKYHDQLVFIGPQFHAILSAHLTGVPYLPLAYDNKVTGLLRAIAPESTPIPIASLAALDLQRFIDKNFSGEPVAS